MKLRAHFLHFLLKSYSFHKFKFKCYLLLRTFPHCWLKYVSLLILNKLCFTITLTHSTTSLEWYSMSPSLSLSPHYTYLLNFEPRNYISKIFESLQHCMMLCTQRVLRVYSITIPLVPPGLFRVTTPTIVWRLCKETYSNLFPVIVDPHLHPVFWEYGPSFWEIQIM